MAELPTRAHPQRQTVRYTKTRIAVTRGPSTGRSLDAAGTSVRIGTSPECDLVVDDDTVSRQHCEIELTETGLRVRDTGSTNGVRAGGVSVFDAVFRGAVTLEIGETAVTLTPLSETVEREQVHRDRLGDLLGSSRRMRELYADVERIAATDVTVLVEGETGTGKDLVAETIHRASERAEEPFVVFDCSAVAPTLIESELFGHERGAFTGAVGTRIGVFEQADKGTLFLDEIGELSKELQPKLLRALEKREIKRVGARKTTTVDVRLVAATNRNLLAEVQRGQFRQDLYYRIAAAHVSVPPLRDRLDDLRVLVQHFLALERTSMTADEIPPDVWEMFRAHRWPGNVRELRNAVQRLLVTPRVTLGGTTSESGVVETSGAGTDGPEPLRIARRRSADAFERAYLRSLLARTEGNVTRAAAIAEVSRQMIQKLMRKHGVV
jgi:transcriptional regulator with PAS, ATPase and Fis domain